jgi:hypothetical protein
VGIFGLSCETSQKAYNTYMTELEKDIDSQLGHLAYLRDAWDDEIPSEVVHSDSRMRTKARRNWFVGVVGAAQNAMLENEITDPFKREAAQKLVDQFTSDDFKDRELTTESDIRIANDLIDIILGRKNK